MHACMLVHTTASVCSTRGRCTLGRERTRARGLQAIWSSLASALTLILPTPLPTNTRTIMRHTTRRTRVPAHVCAYERERA